MRLFEAILDANHRAVAGDQNAGVHPTDFVDELPIAALTCIDPRLNPLLPSVLGVPEAQFIWLRNAGNIITGSTSSTTRSLALACAVKGAKEIVIIGHTDCQVAKTTTMQLLERLNMLGVERHLLPDNLTDYFGLFSSERQNVATAVEFVRHSPLIGSKIAVHGLLVDIGTGRLEWLVNGYQAIEAFGSHQQEVAKRAGRTVDTLKSFADFNIGEMKFPDTKIGEIVTLSENWLSEKSKQLGDFSSGAAIESKPATPPKIPLPPPVRPRIHLARRPK